jgi:hypothetical protein
MVLKMAWVDVVMAYQVCTGSAMETSIKERPVLAMLISV